MMLPLITAISNKVNILDVLLILPSLDLVLDLGLDLGLDPGVVMEEEVKMDLATEMEM
jgi:hypothetical protein